MITLPLVPAEAADFLSSEKAIISNLVVILVTATAVSLVFRRLKLAIIPAYIIAGVIGGPSVFGFARSEPALEAIAHLAVVLLLFGVGMELHLSSLQKGFLRLLGASSGAIAISTAALWAVCMQFGLDPAQSLCTAMALSLSSTALVLRTLSVRRELGTSHGQLSLAILVAQDLAVLGMLALLPILASWGGFLDAAQESRATTEVLRDTGIRLFGIITLLLLAGKVIPLLVRESLQDQTGELPMLAGVGTALMTAYIAQMLGFSLEMGAFIAGFVLASSKFRYHLAGKMSGLRDLFMAIFFTTLGMELNLGVVFENWEIIILGTLALLLVKAAAVSFAAWASGFSARLSVRSGIVLAQAGEFSLILLSQAAELGMFTEVETSVVIAVVMLSLILTPALFHLAPRIGEVFGTTSLAPWFSTPWQGECPKNSQDAAAMHNQVIIAGFGPLGKHLSNKLQQCGISYVIVELNPDTVEAEQQNNRPIVFGDIADVSLLTNLNAAAASAIAITFPDARASAAAVSLARRISPGAFIIARAPTHRDREVLTGVGADHVVVDEDASADEMYAAISTSPILQQPDTAH